MCIEIPTLRLTGTGVICRERNYSLPFFFSLLLSIAFASVENARLVDRQSTKVCCEWLIAGEEQRNVMLSHKLWGISETVESTAPYNTTN